MITEDNIFGVLAILTGIILIAFEVFGLLRYKINKQKVLNGKIIGIDHEARSLRIRYRIDKNKYQEIDYYKSTCFLSGIMPKIGLKVTVTVNIDNPYCPVSVFIAKRMMPFTKIGYMNNSKELTFLRLAGLGTLLVAGGILILTGIF
jgi:hypothetical protein